MANTEYNPAEIESKWQKKWEADRLYHAPVDPSKPKHYALVMLPYPSGDLHIGHWYNYAPSDARARYMRMRGYNVLFPIGFDAFGLPAENAAIKRGIHPKEWTYSNIHNMEEQLRTMGAMFDWEREAISADPEYYKWTEWFFLQFFNNDLAYRKMSPVDWCPNCNTTLAREQVWGEDRHCERCGTPVIKKDLEQWFFRTTRYADELLDFSKIDWPERVQTLQTNWIGKSVGAEVSFPVISNQTSVNSNQSSVNSDSIIPELEKLITDNWSLITVFTTRPDTLWGATFMVLAPEHPLVQQITTPEQQPKVDDYIQQAVRQSDIQREAADKEKTGVFTGGYALNPVNGERIPIWIADYVLMTYGTGAIMAVPAHDQRDFEFARKYNLPVVVVIQPEDTEPVESSQMTEAVPALGRMVNSGVLTGTLGDEAFDRVTTLLEEKGLGKQAVNYRLRDWLISRQRYWGAPIPVVYCPEHGAVPVPEDQLPVLLPDDVEWLPTGESPLKLHPTWKKTTCPVCRKPAVRETDTMDTFMCSSWYHLRYLSPNYHQGPVDPKEYDYWMPVDTYTGGIEHATMHLIYTRFFHKACRDLGIIKGDEPMVQLRNQGIILGEDSEKMSKSRGNVVAPDTLVHRYGADTVRAYLMFFARWEMGAPWSSSGIEGTSRWIRRSWSLLTETSGFPMRTASEENLKALRRKAHQTLKGITHDFDNFEFNTIISSLMQLANEMHKAREQGAYGTPDWQEVAEIYLRMLAPVAPMIAEEIWTEQWRRPYSVHDQSWPDVDEEAAREDEITLVVQVNGKVRDRIVVPADISQEEAKKAGLESEQVKKFLDGQTPKKVIVVPGKLINIVV